MKNNRFMVIFTVLFSTLLFSACSNIKLESNVSNVKNDNKGVEVNENKNGTSSVDFIENEENNIVSTTEDAENSEVKWEVYESDQYKFKLNHPSNWKLSIKDDSKNVIRFKPGGLEGLEYVEINSNNEKLNFDELKKVKIDQYRDVTIEYSEVDISNVRALKIVTGEWGITRYFLLNNNYIYEIVSNGKDSGRVWEDLILF